MNDDSLSRKVQENKTVPLRKNPIPWPIVSALYKLQVGSCSGKMNLWEGNNNCILPFYFVCLRVRFELIVKVQYGKVVPRFLPRWRCSKRNKKVISHPCSTSLRQMAPLACKTGNRMRRGETRRPPSHWERRDPTE